MLKTIEECTLIKEAVSEGIGKPDCINGLCEGYEPGRCDEPCEQCKACVLNEFYEE